MNKNLKLLVVIGGHVLFLILFGLCVWFWQERQAFDAAHYLLEIILRKSFFIAHLRPLGVVSQVLPVMGVWLGVPLKWLMILYSVGDVLYYYLLFLLLTFYFKNERAALWFFIIYLSTIVYSFYCPVTELLQGLALLPVVYCLLEKENRFYKAAIFLLLPLLVFSHPLLFIPTGSLLAFYFIHKNILKENWKLVLWFFVVLVLKFFTLDKYDSQKTFYPVVYNDYGNIHNILDFDYLLSFFKMLFTNYWILFLLFGWSCAQLISNKSYRTLLVYLGCVLGFLSIIICTHHFEHISNYSERMLLPLPCLIALPFIIPTNTSRIQLFSFIFLFGYFIFRLSVIYESGQEFVLRNEQMKRIIDVSRLAGLQKVVADENLLEQLPFANTGWCYSIESMLLSAVDGPDKVVSIAMQHEHIDRIKQLGSKLENNQWIKWTEFILPDDSLPKNYFSFKEQKYVPLISNIVGDSLLRNIRVSIVKTPLQLFHKEVFISVVFDTKQAVVFLPKNTAIRLRYKTQEVLFYLYGPISKHVPQQIPLPSPAFPLNEVEPALVYEN